MAGAFPLLRLPPTVLTTTLQSLDKLDQVSISFVSNRIKALIVSLYLEHRTIILEACRTFDLLLSYDLRPFTLTLNQDNDNTPTPLTTAHSVTVHNRPRVYRWRKEGYGVRDWIDHLMTIFHASKIDILIFSGQAQTFEFASIQNAIKGLEIAQLNTSECSAEYQQAVLEAFPMKNVSLRILSRPNPERFSKVFMQNYDSIEFKLWSELKLNELLTINSRVIDYTTRTNISRMLNQFLKLWKTGSSPRLEYLHIFSVLDFIPDINIILKGIKHTIVEREIQRTFKLEVGRNRGEKMIRGGFDVQGIHGKKATIHIRQDTFEVFVWPR